MSTSLRYNIQANKTDGRLAQLVEHLLDVQVVSGSIPLASTNNKDPIKKIGSLLLCALSDEKRLRKAAKAFHSCYSVLLYLFFPKISLTE